MKKIFFSILFFHLISNQAEAQLNGTYGGNVKFLNTGVEMMSSLTIQSNSTTVKGSFSLINNGQTETYQLTGQKSSQDLYSGEMTYQGKNAFQFTLMQTPQKDVYFAIATVCSGMLNKKSSTQQSITSKPTQKPINNSNLSRDTNLIGKWSEFNTYKSGSINNEAYMVLYADGKMERYTRSSAAFYDNNGNSLGNYNSGGWEIDQNLKQAIDMGCRWYSKGDKFCFSYPDNNPPNCLFYSIEHYNGKINLFTSVSQNSKPQAYTKIN